MNNTVKYHQLQDNVFELTSDEVSMLKDLVSSDDKKSFNKANSIRLYVSSGTINIRVDGGTPTADDEQLEEGQHFIENGDLNKMSVYASTDSKISIQIGSM